VVWVSAIQREKRFSIWEWNPSTMNDGRASPTKDEMKRAFLHVPLGDGTKARSFPFQLRLRSFFFSRI